MLTDFSAWWSALEMFPKVYWMVAIPFSVFFIIQTIVSLFIGSADHDTATQADVTDGDNGVPFQFFSIKNLVAFFTIFGWSGLACINAGLGSTLTIIISVACGLIIMLIMASIFYFMSKLTESGNFEIKNSINKTGTVYLPIPASRIKNGKIQIKVQNSFRELDAVTDETEQIPTGTLVTVTDVLDNNIVVVKKLEQPTIV